MLIDLHTHTSRSDGTVSPAVLVEQAAQRGLDVLGLTDHDTTEGWVEAETAAHEHRVRLVRGIELSTTYDGREVHLLAYLVDPSYPPLAAELARVRAGRGDRLPAMIERLRGLGIEITEDEVRARAGAGTVLGRPHVADVLVDKGIVSRRDEAFATLLAPGGPAYVPRYAAPLRAALALVRDAGGVSVAAHPWGRNQVLTEAVLAELARAGLTGLEVDHQDHTAQQRERLGALAADLGLVATGSSDFHGTGKTNHELGCNTTAPEQYARLLEAAAAARTASGRPAPEVVAP